MTFSALAVMYHTSSIQVQHRRKARIHLYKCSLYDAA